MLRLEMLPAKFGDALWLEYGDEQQPKVVIVDCGFKDNYRELKRRIAQLQPGQLELLVMTHVDDDHIKGGVSLLADPDTAFPKTMDVWFNGWHHLHPADQLSVVQGEIFAALIKRSGVRWNDSAPWSGGTIVVSDNGPLPSGQLPGGLNWTLLSPTWAQLEAMRKVWHEKVAATGLKEGAEESFLELFDDRPDLQPDDELSVVVPSIEKLADADFVEDDKEPNGSSIALLVEFEGKCLLLGADAHPSVLASSLRRLASSLRKPRIELDAFKVAHHGSRKNTSPELLDVIECGTFLFSSSGEKHGHPSPECVARIVTRFRGATLHFNYKSDTNERWADDPGREEYAFTTLYPDEGGRIVEL